MQLLQFVYFVKCTFYQTILTFLKKCFHFSIHSIYFKCNRQIMFTISMYKSNKTDKTTSIALNSTIYSICYKTFHETKQLIQIHAIQNLIFIGEDFFFISSLTLLYLRILLFSFRMSHIMFLHVKYCECTNFVMSFLLLVFIPNKVILQIENISHFNFSYIVQCYYFVIFDTRFFYVMLQLTYIFHSLLNHISNIHIFFISAIKKNLTIQKRYLQYNYKISISQVTYSQPIISHIIFISAFYFLIYLIFQLTIVYINLQQHSLSTDTLKPALITCYCTFL